MMSKVICAFACIIGIACFSSCGSIDVSYDGGGDIDAIVLVVEKRQGKLFARVSNISDDVYTVNLTRSGDLVYDGIYAYDSLFCATQEVRLSVVTDVFNSEIDTIFSNETREYSLTLFTPFIAEVLDSTSIYSFSFQKSESGRSKVTHFVVSAEAVNGSHEFKEIGKIHVDTDGISGQFKMIDPALCSELKPVTRQN